MRFQRKIILLIIIVSIIPVMLYLGIDIMKDYRYIETEAKKDAKTFALQLASGIESYVDLLNSRVSFFESSIIRKRKAPDLQEDDVLSFAKTIDNIMEVNVYNIRQEMAFKYSPDAELAVRTFGNEDLPNEDIQTGFEYLTATPFFMIVHRNEDAGYIGIKVSLDAIQKHFEAFQYKRSGHALMLRADGRVLTHPKKEFIGKDFSSTDIGNSFYQRKDPASNSLFGQNELNTHVLSAFVPVKNTGWIVVVQDPVDEVFANFRAKVFRAVLVSLLLILVGYFSGKVFANRLVVPLHRLSGAARKFSENFVWHNPDIKTGDEIEELAHTFRLSAQEIEQKKLAIEEKLNRLSILREIDVAVLSSVNLNEILCETLKRMGSIIKCDFLSIISLEQDLIKIQTAEHNPVKCKIYERAYIRHRSSILKLFSINSHILVNNRGTEMLHSNAVHEIITDEISSFLLMPMRTKNKTTGLICLSSRLENFFSDEHITFCEEIAYQLSVAIANARLIKRLENAVVDSVMGLVKAIEAKDKYTKGHAERVKSFSLLIAERLHMEEPELRNLVFAAILHDIGKIGIDSSILEKPNKLNGQEYDEIMKHVNIGLGILAQVKHLRPAMDIILHHHERWDGKGYPLGERKERIPLAARIIAVVDAYDAMTTRRADREPMSHDEAIAELRRCAGTQFDPRIVNTFIEILEQEVRERKRQVVAEE